VALNGHSNCIGLEWANPDWQVAAAIYFTEHNNAVLRQETYANTIYSYTYHGSAFRQVGRADNHQGVKGEHIWLSSSYHDAKLIVKVSARMQEWFQ
jgi:hypothetical protein